MGLPVGYRVRVGLERASLALAQVTETVLYSFKSGTDA